MISERDLQIVKCLRKNARQTLSAISQKTNIPVSTIYDGIKRNEAELIKKYTSIVDFSKLGFNIRIKLLLNTKEPEKLREFIIKNRNVNSAYTIEGEYDFLLDCIFKEMDEVSNFTEKLDKFNVDSKKMFYVINELKREGFLNH